ncbi:hypothetical protein C0L73_14605, partial [Clostridium perfringens]
MFNGISLKEVAEKYCLIPKGVRYRNINGEDITELVKVGFENLDMFECYSDEELKNSYIVKRKSEKKLSDEEV